MSKAIQSINRQLRSWINRRKRAGEVVTSDEVWNHIKKKYGYLTSHERESVFQAAEDHKWTHLT